MAYSSEFSRAITIVLFIHMKMEEFGLEFVSTKVIAEFLVIPAPTVVKILKSLNAAGITTSKEGPKGGILLAKPISNITLLDVFLAVEHGPMFKAQLEYAVSNPRIESAKATIAPNMPSTPGIRRRTSGAIQTRGLSIVALRSIISVDGISIHCGRKMDDIWSGPNHIS